MILNEGTKKGGQNPPPQTPKPNIKPTARPKVQYNVCEVCGAKDGRAGLLIKLVGCKAVCENCNDTAKTGKIVIHVNLIRTDEELEKTFNILKETK